LSLLQIHRLHTLILFSRHDISESTKELMKEAQKDVKVLGKLDGGVPSENVCAVSVTKKNIFSKKKKLFIYLFFF